MEIQRMRPLCSLYHWQIWQEYKAKVLERQPIRMEIGAVFSHAPSKHNLISKDVTPQPALWESYGIVGC